MSTRAWTRTHTVVAVIGAAVLVAAAGLALALRPAASPSTMPPASISPTAVGSTAPSTPQPRPSASAVDPLTGGQPSGHEVIAVKVENIQAARPQVGLRQADIVFAEEVEGAQTRLIAVYHSTFPRRLGPVRSARSTDVQLLPMFGRPGLVYSGANARVQRRIDKASIVPIQRSTRDNRRVAPHNVFIDLAEIARTRKVGKATSIGWTFDPARPSGSAAAGSPKATVGHDTFAFRYGSGRYTVRWNGRSYADGDTGALAKTDNVVVLRVRNREDGNRDVLGAPSVLSETVGTGKVTVYRDGRAVTGKWRRDAVSGPMTLTDPGGKAIALKPGKTWVMLVG